MYQLGFDFQAVPPTFVSNRSGFGAPWVAQTSFCSYSERSPQKYLVPSGRSQIRPELSQPDFSLRRAANNVRRRFELDAVLMQESMNGVDIRNAKVNLRPPLRLLALRDDSHE
jgi:hypothetical protein